MCAIQTPIIERQRTRLGFWCALPPPDAPLAPHPLGALRSGVGTQSDGKAFTRVWGGDMGPAANLAPGRTPTAAVWPPPLLPPLLLRLPLPSIVGPRSCRMDGFSRVGAQAMSHIALGNDTGLHRRRKPLPRATQRHALRMHARLSRCAAEPAHAQHGVALALMPGGAAASPRQGRQAVPATCHGARRQARLGPHGMKQQRFSDRWPSVPGEPCSPCTADGACGRCTRANMPPPPAASSCGGRRPLRCAAARCISPRACIAACIVPIGLCSVQGGFPCCQHRTRAHRAPKQQ